MRRLIVNADDFGTSHRVNEAVERCHQAGLLTQASLMVNEPEVEEALRIVRRNPGLEIGLHLTLCTDAAGKYIQSPVLAGLRYLLDPRTRSWLGEEIGAQFQRFLDLGFGPHYFDGHTHIHLNPAVFPLVLPAAKRHGFRAVRLVREWGAFQPKPFILHRLSERARPALVSAGVRFADGVFGLSCTGKIDTVRVAQILGRVPDGLSEFYFHPGTEPGELEFEPLLEIIRVREIALTSWREQLAI